MTTRKRRGHKHKRNHNDKDETKTINHGDMSDVGFPDHITNATSSTAMDLKTQGNQLFSAQHFGDAKEAYAKAIAVNPQIEMYQTIWQNLSLVHLKQNQLSSAVQYSAAAILCGSESVKVYFRMAKALAQLNHVPLAICCCHHIQQCKDAEFKRLYSDLKKKSKQQQHDGTVVDVLQLWEDMDMIQLLSTDLPLVEQKHLLTPAEEDVLQLKQRGNDCVGLNAFEEAQIHYEKALQLLEANNEVPIATLLANCANGSMQLGEFKKAMLESTIAVLLNATYSKAHYRRILSLINLGLPSEAKKALEYGERVLGLEKATCLKPLKPRLAAKPVTKRDSVALHEQQNEYAPIEAVAMMNILADLQRDKAKEIGYETRPVAAFHQMYADENCWPVQANVEECKKVLQASYELARYGGEKMQLLHAPEDDPNLVLKRAGTRDREDLERLFTLEMGQIYVRKRRPYGLHHNFGNVAQVPQHFVAGKTHVSIGFADLQELCIGRFIGESVLPINWVGYDQSPFVIAKTMVLIEMMQQSNCDPISVIQVWYSAAWSHKTSTDFRRALTSVLNRFVPSCEEERKVESYFHCWQQHTITLKMARKGWLESHVHGSWSYDIGNWRLKSDQLAMCTYALTGQIFAAEVGSVVMYALPNDEGAAAFDESVFHIIRVADLLTQREKQNCANCMDAVTTLLTDRVGALTKQIQTGTIRARVKLGSISRKNVSLLEEIRALSPWSMSWSNVCDYITPTDFHYIARCCSAPSDTMHFGYSMNWTMETKGTSILDFPREVRKETFEALEKGMKRMFSEYSPTYKKYLAMPPITNPMNLTDFCLTTVHYRKWFENFMEADIFGPHQGLSEKTEYSVLYSSSTSITFNFTYDPQINMNPRALNEHLFVT